MTNFDNKTQTVIFLLIILIIIHLIDKNEYFDNDTSQNSVECTSELINPKVAKCEEKNNMGMCKKYSCKPGKKLVLSMCYDIKDCKSESESESLVKPDSESLVKPDSESLVKPDSESSAGDYTIPDSSIINTESKNTLCKAAFDNYNLYPSSNSLIIKGNDINWNLNNNITDYQTLNNIGTKNYPVINNIVPDYNPADIDSTKKAFNTLLEKTPTKIGCCYRNKNDNGRRTVLVRTPLNPSDTNVDPLFQQFDFQFKSLTIPEGTCPVDYYGGSPDCDAFYDVYCTNVLNEFQKQNLKPEDFSTYAPECACYAPRTDQQKIYPLNTPPACFKTKCDNIYNSTSYVDPVSRAQPCDITVCQNIFNSTVGNVSGNVWYRWWI